jgi:hypothetical protein
MAKRSNLNPNWRYNIKTGAKLLQLEEPIFMVSYLWHTRFMGIFLGFLEDINKLI